MRAFARPFPLQQLSLEASVLYAGFCVFLLFGVWTSAWLAHDDGFGTDSATVVRYYRGDDATTTTLTTTPSTTTAPVATDGPAIALPDEVVNDDAKAALHVEKSARQVMETFHFHSFTMPVVLLIVGHIFMMCAVSLRKKVVVLVVASLSTLLHLLLPVVVRFGGAGVAHVGAALFVPTAVLMLLTWTLMLVRPLVELARRPSAEREAAAGAGS
jgi:hypothetical protein